MTRPSIYPDKAADKMIVASHTSSLTGIKTTKDGSIKVKRITSIFIIVEFVLIWIRATFRFLIAKNDDMNYLMLISS